MSAIATTNDRAITIRDGRYPDRESIREFFSTLWGDEPLPGNISICHLYDPVDRDSFACSGFCSTIEDAADLAAECAIKSCVWQGVGLIRSDLASGRGGSKDVVALPGLWCEIDYGKPNGPPDLTTALAVAAALPLRPTIIVHSGHGLHCYWLFQELLHLLCDVDRAWAHSLLCAARSMINKELHRRGFAPADSIFDLARVLRPVGTENCKDPSNRLPVTCFEYHETTRYLPEDFEEHIPELPPVEPKEPKESVDDPNWEVRPGDDFNARASWDQTARLMNWTCKQGRNGGFELLRCASEKYGAPSSLFTGKTGYKGRDRITIFSGNCGLKCEPDELGRRPSYSKFELFAAVVFEGDFKVTTQYLADNGYGKKREEPQKDDETRFAELLGPICTNGELIARAKPPIFLVRNFCTAGTLVVWAAPEKSWKTTLALMLALVVTGHGKFLSLYEAPSYLPVIYFSGESGDWPLKSMQERILDWMFPCDVVFDGQPMSMKPHPASIPITWGGDPPDLGHPDTIPALADLIRRTGARLLILDPSQALFGSISEDVKNDFAMRQYLKKLQLLARETGCCIVLLHHFRQHVTPGFPKRSDSSYGAFTKFCDTWILMNPRAEPTGDEEPGSGKLWITWGSRDGFGATHAIDIAEGTHETGRFFSLEVVEVDAAIGQLAEAQAVRKGSARKAASKATAEWRKADIRETLAGKSVGVSRDTLAGLMDTSRPTITPTVNAMLEAGELVQAPFEYGNNGGVCWSMGLALPETVKKIIEVATSKGWKPPKQGTGATPVTHVNQDALTPVDAEGGRPPKETPT